MKICTWNSQGNPLNDAISFGQPATTDRRSVKTDGYNGFLYRAYKYRKQ